MILWLADSPSFARTTISIVDWTCVMRQYLAIVQNKAEMFRDRSERRIGVWGFFYPAEG